MISLQDLIYNSLTVISIPPVFSNENHTIIQSSFLHHLTLFVEKSLLCKPLLESPIQMTSTLNLGVLEVVTILKLGQILNTNNSTSLIFVTADFGVSAKNTKTLQRRDSFIGTPYW